MSTWTYLFIFLTGILTGFGIGMMVATINIIASFEPGFQIMIGFGSVATATVSLTWIGWKATKTKRIP